MVTVTRVMMNCQQKSYHAVCSMKVWEIQTVGSFAGGGGLEGLVLIFGLLFLFSKNKIN